MKNTAVFILCLLLISPGLSGQELISKRAKQDQIASKLWTALGSALNKKLQCQPAPVFDQLADRFGITNQATRIFLRYALNYNSESLSSEQVLYRYPHYNKDSIRHDLAYLEDLKLLERNSDRWTITTTGKMLKKEYWQSRTASFESCKVDNNYTIELISIAEKLITAYAENETFQSLRLRIQNRPDSLSQWPPALRASELQRDLTTVFNDNGHYRIDLLLASSQSNQWPQLQLSALAKELLGATRNQRIYPVNRCYNQANWRAGKQGCDDAISELLTSGLVVLKNDSIRQTEPGHELFQSADRLADNRLYAAWDVLSTEEYENLLEVLDWLTKPDK